MFIAYAEAQKRLLLFVVKDLASYTLFLCYIICPGINLEACLFFKKLFAYRYNFFIPEMFTINSSAAVMFCH